MEKLHEDKKFTNDSEGIENFSLFIHLTAKNILI